MATRRDKASRAGFCDGVWVLATPDEVRGQSYERPLWRRPNRGSLAAAVQPGLVAVLGHDGSLTTFAIDSGKDLGTRALGESLTHLVSGADACWLAFGEERSLVVRPSGETPVALSGVGAAAFDAATARWLVATADGRAAFVTSTGTLEDAPAPPAPVRTLARADEGTWLALGREESMRLENGAWSAPTRLPDGEHSGRFVAVSSDGARSAWIDDTQSLVLHKRGARQPGRIATWPREDSAYAPLHVSGLAFYRPRQILVAFTSGRSHLLDLDAGPMMMDRFEHDRATEWAFFYGEATCVGGDADRALEPYVGPHEPDDDADSAVRTPAREPVTAPTQESGVASWVAAGLPSPRAALAALSDAIVELAEDCDFTDYDWGFVVEHADLFLPEELDGTLVDFEMGDDDWSYVIEATADPCFFPIGGADGNYLGLYLHAPSLARGVRPPVVFYFHEDDPPFSFVAETMGHLDGMIRAAARNKGKWRAPKVAAERGQPSPELLAALEAVRFSATGEPADEERALIGRLLFRQSDAARDEAGARLEAIYEEQGHAFALTNLRARRSGRPP